MDGDMTDELPLSYRELEKIRQAIPPLADATI